jgi:hypothetical protein
VCVFASQLPTAQFVALVNEVQSVALRHPRQLPLPSHLVPPPSLHGVPIAAYVAVHVPVQG